MRRTQLQARLKDEGLMIRIRPFPLSLAVVLLGVAASSARAADPPIPEVAELTVPPVHAPAPPFPAASVRRWQIGDRADRLQHASLSLVLGLSAGLATKRPAAAASAFAFGVAKELWDLRSGSGFDVGDLIADALGVAAGAGATRALQDQK
jgi:hypothetical protein